MTEEHLSQGSGPKDDNLRLVLSEEHTAWLDAKITTTRRAVAILLVTVVVGVAATVGAFNLLDDPPGPVPRMGYIILAGALTFIAAAELIRRLLNLKKYRDYTADHESFLKKYNRL